MIFEIFFIEVEMFVVDDADDNVSKYR